MLLEGRRSIESCWGVEEWGLHIASRVGVQAIALAMGDMSVSLSRDCMDVGAGSAAAAPIDIMSYIEGSP